MINNPAAREIKTRFIGCSSTHSHPVSTGWAEGYPRPP
jgi:hypothetical protein